jgi:hypothetical protein
MSQRPCASRHVAEVTAFTGAWAGFRESEWELRRTRKKQEMKRGVGTAVTTSTDKIKAQHTIRFRL